MARPDNTCPRNPESRASPVSPQPLKLYDDPNIPYVMTTLDTPKEGLLPNFSCIRSKVSEKHIEVSSAPCQIA